MEDLAPNSTKAIFAAVSARIRDNDLRGGDALPGEIAIAVGQTDACRAGQFRVQLMGAG